MKLNKRSVIVECKSISGLEDGIINNLHLLQSASTWIDDHQLKLRYRYGFGGWSILY